MKVSVPKDFLLGPFFAATPRDGVRTVTIAGRAFQIGGFDPLDPERKGPCLDVRHARAIAALLSFRGRDPYNPEIAFSLRGLSQRYCKSYGGKHAQRIRGLLADLLNIYIRVQEPGSDHWDTYRLIERIDFPQPANPDRKGPDPRAEPHRVWLSAELLILLNNLGRLQPLELDALGSLSSRWAQAIYLFLPSRAYHHKAAKPFEISLTRLLDQIGAPIPATRKLRKKLFTQHERSILKQLDGIQTLTGRLRVEIREVAGGGDYKLCAWVEPNVRQSEPKPPKPRGKLITAFLAKGGTEEELTRKLKNRRDLDEYEQDLLRRGAIVVAGNEQFFTLARALLGPDRFRGLLAEAKGDHLEGRPATKSPTARLIHRILEAIG